ncbi:transglutaminase domain-containing protein [Ichthyenterobacterium sp. W332]|uniref:Transglutaminase domain-containing protein n=1 Tax=Microcosmobacter mediterraneus TaxID=3075607 RepID=A0ABU2YJF4_9FLAO|nr:transglutaminase domain-containing protein [Ichthyenterobacterium sp. W332]MDT0557365.1 transglutaminase domain-containing protein [Ichthyenterobacterium sp. W332]
MLLKKIVWLFKRHPFLYLIRFKLLSKNTDPKSIETLDYNITNGVKDIPKLFVDINDKIFCEGKPKSELEQAKTISTWLYQNIKGGPGLSEPSEKALEIMLSGQGGVCSDMAQIFNNFCVINNIRVREWGTTRIPFDKLYGGHSFNEIYCNTLKKWVLIDVSYCALFQFNNSIPISVDELYSKKEKVKIRHNFFSEVDAKLEQSVVKNYYHLDNVSFLVHNYSNKIYDTYLNRFKPFLPVFFIHFLVYIQRKSYRYLFPYNDFSKLFS